MRSVKGNIIELAKEGRFELIAHGANCMNIMGAGLALQIKEAFPDAYTADKQFHASMKEYQMMGNFSEFYFWEGDLKFYILNLYTQRFPGAPSPGCTIPLDYEALTTCLRKINYQFTGSRIGLPLIGCGLAQGNKVRVLSIIEEELNNLDVTIVEYEQGRPMVKSRLGENISGRTGVYNLTEGQRREGFVEGGGGDEDLRERRFDEGFED